jgi:hypothetical protein
MHMPNEAQFAVLAVTLVLIVGADFIGAMIKRAFHRNALAQAAERGRAVLKRHHSFNLSSVNRRRKKAGKRPLTHKQACEVAGVYDDDDDGDGLVEFMIGYATGIPLSGYGLIGAMLGAGVYGSSDDSDASTSSSDDDTPATNDDTPAPDDAAEETETETETESTTGESDASPDP